MLFAEGYGSSVPLNISVTFFDGSTTPPHDIVASAAAHNTAAANRKRMMSLSIRAGSPFSHTPQGTTNERR
jgi:hypothetical protein